MGLVYFCYKVGVFLNDRKQEGIKDLHIDTNVSELHKYSEKH